MRRSTEVLVVVAILTILTGIVVGADMKAKQKRSKMPKTQTSQTIKNHKKTNASRRTNANRSPQNKNRVQNPQRTPNSQQQRNPQGSQSRSEVMRYINDARAKAQRGDYNGAMSSCDMAVKVAPTDTLAKSCRKKNRINAQKII